MFIQIASDPPTSTSKDALIELERSMPSEKEFSELLAKADEKVFGLLKRQSKTRNLCIAGASSKQPGYFNLEFYNVPEKDIRNLAELLKIVSALGTPSLNFYSNCGRLARRGMGVISIPGRSRLTVRESRAYDSFSIQRVGGKAGTL